MLSKPLQSGKTSALILGVLLYLLAPLSGLIWPAGSQADWSGLICSAAGNQSQVRQTLSMAAGWPSGNAGYPSQQHAGQHQCCSVHAPLLPFALMQDSQPALHLLKQIQHWPVTLYRVIRPAWVMPLSRAPPLL